MLRNKRFFESNSNMQSQLTPKEVAFSQKVVSKIWKNDASLDVERILDFFKAVIQDYKGTNYLLYVQAKSDDTWHISIAQHVSREHKNLLLSMAVQHMLKSPRPSIAKDLKVERKGARWCVVQDKQQYAQLFYAACEMLLPISWILLKRSEIKDDQKSWKFVCSVAEKYGILRDAVQVQWRKADQQIANQEYAKKLYAAMLKQSNRSNEDQQDDTSISDAVSLGIGIACAAINPFSF